MKKFFISVIGVISFLALSCEDTTKTDTTVLNGYVYYFDENNLQQPVTNALVYAKNMFAQAKSDGSGNYQISIEPTEDELEITLEASKVGFNISQVSVLAKKGETVNVPDITLTRLIPDSLGSPTDTIKTSGPAAHIEVYGKHPSHIYIQSSGLKETALLHLVVTDAQGLPVDKAHKTTVNFAILNGPDGGEYLYPQSMETQNGYVYTILNSGTIAGPVQILASAQVDSKTIRALPIRMAIYGGLPDARHFSLALEQVNIAGRVHFGILDAVTAFVGDRYSNPVAPGTVVYFSTDFGIIEGAAVTDDLGRATVRFISAQPLPPNPAVSSFAHILASTYNDTLLSEKITTQTQLLLSDHTDFIQVTPDVFTYDITNTPVKFDYVVSDIWDYPVIGGSNIQVSATDGDVYGDISINMLDTQSKGPGTTQFSFTWAPGDSLEAPQVYISIKVTTPQDGNGYRSVNILGTKTP